MKTVRPLRTLLINAAQSVGRTRAETFRSYRSSTGRLVITIVLEMYLDVACALAARVVCRRSRSWQTAAMTKVGHNHRQSQPCTGEPDTVRFISALVQQVYVIIL